MFLQQRNEISDLSDKLAKYKSKVCELEQQEHQLKVSHTSSVQESQAEVMKMQQRLNSQEGKVADLTDELATLQRHYDEQCQSNDDLKAQMAEVKSTLAEAQRSNQAK